MGLFGGGSDTTTQKTELNPQQQQVFQQLFGRANDAFSRLNNIGPFGGDFVAAAPSANELAGRGSVLAGARGFDSSGAARDVLNLGRATARGDFVRPDAPHIRGMIDAAVRPVNESFQEVTLPGIRAGAAGVGGFDNLRRNLVETEAAQNKDRIIGDIGSQITFGATEAERGRQNAAGNIIGQALPLSTAPGQIIASVGEAERGDRDRALANDFMKFQEQINAIMRPLSMTAPFISPLLGTGTTTTRTEPGVSPLAGGISGGIGGASAGAGIAQALGSSSALGPVGLGILGLLGGLFG